MDNLTLIALNDFQTDVQKSLEMLLSNDYTSLIVNDGNALSFLECDTAYEITLTLYNISGLPENYDDAVFCFDELRKDEKGYFINGTYIFDYDSAAENVTLYFTDAKSKFSVYRADKGFIWSKPWDSLLTIADAIMQKYNYDNACINALEKENLDLIRELYMLSAYITDDEIGVNMFRIIREYFTSYKYEKPIKILDKFENETDFQEIVKQKDLLVDELNKKRYEPLWRELFALICSTQEGYPVKEDECPDDLLSEIKAKITNTLSSNGYKGEFPAFYKEDSVRGVKFGSSLGGCYLFLPKKRVIRHICCEPEFFNGYLDVNMYFGNEILSANDSIGDIYSCMFKDSNTNYDSAFYNQHYRDFDGNVLSDDLDKTLNAVIKKTEQKHLNKEERKIFGDFLPAISVFVLFAMVISVIITGILMLAGVLLLLILGLGSEIPSMFSEIPWHILFLLSTAIITCALFFLQK